MTYNVSITLNQSFIAPMVARLILWATIAWIGKLEGISVILGDSGVHVRTTAQARNSTSPHSQGSTHTRLSQDTSVMLLTSSG